MKMDLAKVHGCLAMSILPLLLLVNPTAACYCVGPNRGYATAYCRSDAVFGGSFVNARYERGDKTWVIYEFKVTDVFKGPINVGDKIDLYSKLLGTTCGYRHAPPFGDVEFLVTGNMDEDRIAISICSLIQPWTNLAPNKSDGVEQLHNTRCE